MILSGEAKIDKKELEELSSRPAEEIAVAALEIEEGAYKKKKDESLIIEESRRPVETILSEIRTLETSIRKISNGIDSEMPKIIKEEDRTGMKTALRSYIDRLEDLYRRM
jgi:hypothetical protein